MLAAALPDLALCPLDHWSVIRLHGPDASKFLQGQTTCDLRELASRQLLAGAQCDFKGKAWMLFWLCGDSDDLLLFTSRDSATAALPELKKYATFSRVEVSDASPHFSLYGLIGLEAAQALAEMPSPEAPVMSTAWGKLIRLPWPSLRFICAVHDDAAFRRALPPTLHSASAELWTRLDIEAGYPQLAAATINQYVPQALNLHLLDGISFTKGCYMGQETVARMKYRGGNKRGVFRLIGSASHCPAAGSEIELKLGDDWRHIGVVLQAAGQGKELEVQAVLPLDSDCRAEFRLANDDTSQLQLAALPYALDAG